MVGEHEPRWAIRAYNYRCHWLCRWRSRMNLALTCIRHTVRTVSRHNSEALCNVNSVDKTKNNLPLHQTVLRLDVVKVRLQASPESSIFPLYQALGLCYVQTQFYLALYMCVFILNGFPCSYS